jgi:hypothetical protein
MEWPELKYSSGVTWASTCQLESNSSYLTIQSASRIQHISLHTICGTACRTISDPRVLQLHIEVVIVTPFENLS